MYFEFVPHPHFDFVASFAEKFKVPVQDDRLVIPSDMGTGQHPEDKTWCRF